ncbi:MAG: M20/M25/M40 family metallo-hydrolase [Bdellovibrionales bacterium]
MLQNGILTFLTLIGLTPGVLSKTRPLEVPILADLQDLKKLGIAVYAQDLENQVGLAFTSDQQRAALQHQSHDQGKCGGFEVLPASPNPESHVQQLRHLHQVTRRMKAVARGPWRQVQIHKQSWIESALGQVQDLSLHETVTWLSSFKSRNEKSANPNEHIVQLKAKIEELIRQRSFPVQVELVGHSNTRQQSLRARIPGRVRPSEIVVLGGHHDSVNSSWSGRDHAPGADDNASGSANLLEILRVLLQQTQPERTIEIFWYAAEESGLLGSSEIAKAYRQQKADVIGVLQLDMTAYPGSGDMTIASLTDFTHPWMQQFLKELNQKYVGLNILDDSCGYGCSDHASWYRQGYPTVVPFEARSRNMNPAIHSKNDVISPSLNFQHSAAIAKLSLAWALELANSNLRAP